MERSAVAAITGNFACDNRTFLAVCAIAGRQRACGGFGNRLPYEAPHNFLRRDIVDRKQEELRQEAPFACKGIGPVVEMLHGAGIARPVAELRPLLTVKGTFAPPPPPLSPWPSASKLTA